MEWLLSLRLQPNNTSLANMLRDFRCAALLPVASRPANVNRWVGSSTRVHQVARTLWKMRLARGLAGPSNGSAGHGRGSAIARLLHVPNAREPRLRKLQDEHA